MLALKPFGVTETHGIVARPGNELSASSDGYQWTAMFASRQREMPYEGVFAPVKDQLLVLHRDGPVRVDRTRGTRLENKLVPAGGIHLVPGGMEFGVRLAGALNTLHVYIRRGVLEEVAAEMIGGDPSKMELTPQIIDADPVLQTLLSSVGMALDNDDTGTAIYADYLSRAVAAQLIRSYSGAIIRPRPIVGSYGFIGPVVAEALDFMRENLDQQISLVDIARAVNRSPSHLAREFRSDVGLPPHRYLINLRVEKAQRLLERTNTSIAEIAYECGFSHQEHLTRLFRRYCSTTPGAYRKSKRN